MRKLQLVERYETLSERLRRVDTDTFPIHFMTEVDRRLAETGRSLQAAAAHGSELPVELDLWLCFQLTRCESILTTLEHGGTTRVFRYERLYLPTVPHVLIRKIVRLLIRIRARLLGYTADYQTLDLGTAMYLRFAVSDNLLFRWLERIRITRWVLAARKQHSRT